MIRRQEEEDQVGRYRNWYEGTKVLEDGWCRRYHIIAPRLARARCPPRTSVSWRRALGQDIDTIPCSVPFLSE